jgi:hypothetical protein
MGSFKDVLKTAFPFISVAASMGGPLGVMASSAVGKALGIDKVEPTSEGVTAAITTAQATDPDALLKLQQAEDSFRLQMAQLGFDSAEKMLALDSADRADARAREIAVKDKTPRNLAYFTRAALISLVTIFLFRDIPPSVHDIMLILITTIANSYTGQDNYFFGSSSSSAKKTDILADQVKSDK